MSKRKDYSHKVSMSNFFTEEVRRNLLTWEETPEAARRRRAAEAEERAMAEKAGRGSCTKVYGPSNRIEPGRLPWEETPEGQAQAILAERASKASKARKAKARKVKSGLAAKARSEAARKAKKALNGSSMALAVEAKVLAHAAGLHGEARLLEAHIKRLEDEAWLASL